MEPQLRARRRDHVAATDSIFWSETRLTRSRSATGPPRPQEKPFRHDLRLRGLRCHVDEPARAAGRLPVEPHMGWRKNSGARTSGPGSVHRRGRGRARRRFGPFLPSRREWARARCRFVGYVLDFDPLQIRRPAALRNELGYGRSPLVICAVGGTSIGRELLELCGRAYAALRESIPDLQMVLVCGPRLDLQDLRFRKG